MLSHGANSNISRGPRLSILYQLSSILSQSKRIVKNFLKKSSEIFSVLFIAVIHKPPTAPAPAVSNTRTRRTSARPGGRLGYNAHVCGALWTLYHTCGEQIALAPSGRPESK